MLKIALPIFIAIHCCFIPVILSRTKFGTPCDLSCRIERKAKGFPKVPFSAAGWLEDNSAISTRVKMCQTLRSRVAEFLVLCLVLSIQFLGHLLLSPYSYDFSSVLWNQFCCQHGGIMDIWECAKTCNTKKWVHLPAISVFTTRFLIQWFLKRLVELRPCHFDNIGQHT